jgi:lysozyme
MSDDASIIASQVIKHYESCELKPYQHTGDVPTIGWGNTIWQDGTKVSLDDDPITQGAADALFLFWLIDFTKKVSPHLPGAKPNELAAFVSLAYNIGVVAFTRSTALRRYLGGNKSLVGPAIELWDKSAGVVLKGLQRRRRAEHLVFNGTAPATAIAQAEEDYP